MLKTENHRAFPPMKCLMAVIMMTAWLLSVSAANRGLHARDATPPANADTAKKESLKAMLARVNRMIVKIPTGEDSRRAELLESPLLHYSDQVRNLPESTLWVWQHEGLPVLFCKVERMTNVTNGAISWQYCCVPATGDKTDVEWERQLRWRARDTSFAWAPLAD